MDLPSIEQYPDDGGGTSPERQLSLGLYNSYGEIPVGLWGYIVDPDNPVGFTGPFYIETPEEELVGLELEHLRTNELAQATAPITLDKLVAIAAFETKTPELEAERARIIDSDVSWINGYRGVVGTIKDIYIESVETLVLSLAEERAFNRSGTFSRARLACWRFEIQRIRNFNSELTRLSFTYKQRARTDGVYTIERTPRDPRVIEVQEKAKMLTEKKLPDIKKIVNEGDYDPRLYDFLTRFTS